MKLKKQRIPVTGRVETEQQPQPQAQTETSLGVPSPEELEREFGVGGETSTEQDIQTEEPAQTQGSAEPVVNDERRPSPPQAEVVITPERPVERLVVRDSDLLKAMSKMFCAAALWPGFDDPEAVGQAVQKMSQASCELHRQLLDTGIDMPITACNALISDEWTASLFRQGNQSPAIRIDSFVAGCKAGQSFLAQSALDGQQRTGLQPNAEAALLHAVAEVSMHLESYQRLVAEATDEKLLIDSEYLLKELAAHFVSSIEALIGITALNNENSRVALFNALPNLFQVVWGEWRGRIFNSIKAMSSPAEGYRYLTGDIFIQGFPLRQVKDDCHELLRRVVGTVLHIQQRRGAHVQN